jgi:hypothetical protein
MKKFIKFIDKNIFFNIFKKIYIKYLIYTSKKYLNSHPNYKIYSKKIRNNRLSNLFDKYGSDKGNISINNNTHFYSSFYYELFKKKNKIKLVFECGIGTTNETIHSNMSKDGNPGASLKAYRDYFQNSIIYGADIDKNILFNSNRIKTYYVDQLNKNSIKRMWKKINKNKFDLIIDDGMHDLEAVYTFFMNSFLKLKKNGLYIIEDVHISYLKELAIKLKNFNIEIISSSKKNNIDDYLFLIRKH